MINSKITIKTQNAVAGGVIVFPQPPIKILSAPKTQTCPMFVTTPINVVNSKKNRILLSTTRTLGNTTAIMGEHSNFQNVPTLFGIRPLMFRVIFSPSIQPNTFLLSYVFLSLLIIFLIVCFLIKHFLHLNKKYKEKYQNKLHIAHCIINMEE
jgi:hypothetical protein